MAAEMQSAIFAGASALVGTVLGSWLNKRSQRESWLAQKRAEVFATFLLDLYKYRRDTIKETEDATVKELALEMIYTSANIVSLYLPEAIRSEFRRNFERYVKFEPGPVSVHQIKEAFTDLYESEKNMQQLFEKTLKDNKSL